MGWGETAVSRSELSDKEEAEESVTLLAAESRGRPDVDR